MATRFKTAALTLLMVPALANAGLFGSSNNGSQKLEPNVQITLPKGLKLRAYPMPIPGASNYRIDTGSMRIAITGIPLSMDGQPAPVRTDDEMKELALQSATQYRPGAANPDAAPSQVKGAGWTATYVSYSAKPGSAGFVPFMGAAYQCVSTGQVTTTRTVFVITVGSPDCYGTEHQGFLKALETITVNG
ncbi:hypothetical protein [Lysobacter sp. P5_B9]